MANKMVNESDLIKAVFATQQGEQLLDFWEKVYGERISYMEGQDTNSMLVREGERKFYLEIKYLLELKIWVKQPKRPHWIT